MKTILVKPEDLQTGDSIFFNSYFNQVSKVVFTQRKKVQVSTYDNTIPEGVKTKALRRTAKQMRKAKELYDKGYSRMDISRIVDKGRQRQYKKDVVEIKVTGGETLIFDVNDRVEKVLEM